MPAIRVDNFAVDYHETGTGLPIVFIPGITEFKEEFGFQFHGLADSYRIISYDLRRGLKRAADYTLDLLVEDLKGFMRAIHVHGAVICGHSFGGLVAMEFALRYPDLAKALVLVSAYPSALPIPAQELISSTSAADHPHHRAFGTRLKMRVARILGRPSPGMIAMADEVTAVRAVARQAASTSKTTISQRVRIIQRSDFRSRLPELDMPTLVVAGARDRSVFLSSAQALYEGIPNSSLDVIEDAGHFCFLTRHDQFNTVVDEFLTSHLAEIA